MGKVIKFVDIKTQKQTFNQHKEPISIKKDIDIDKIVVSNKVSFQKKGYLSDRKMLKNHTFLYISIKNECI